MNKKIFPELKFRPHFMHRYYIDLKSDTENLNTPNKKRIYDHNSFGEWRRLFPDAPQEGVMPRLLSSATEVVKGDYSKEDILVVTIETEEELELTFSPPHRVLQRLLIEGVITQDIFGEIKADFKWLCDICRQKQTKA